MSHIYFQPELGITGIQGDFFKDVLKLLTIQGMFTIVKTFKRLTDSLEKIIGRGGGRKEFGFHTANMASEYVNM